MRKVILGTKNRHKVREIGDILLSVPIDLVPLPDETPESPEDQETLDGNAAQKASYYAKLTDSFCLADDTGLEVDALNGEPGVHSARYAGPDATYADNRDKLLAALTGVPKAGWTARFRCVMSLANPAGEIVATAEGTVEGQIIAESRGEGGFGYDPIFRPLESERTLAELSAEEKNALSHRGRALQALRPRLLELL